MPTNKIDVFEIPHSCQLDTFLRVFHYSFPRLLSFLIAETDFSI